MGSWLYNPGYKTTFNLLIAVFIVVIVVIVIITIVITLTPSFSICKLNLGLFVSRMSDLVRTGITQIPSSKGM